MVYDKEWDRPLIHRLSSVRKHVLTALDKAIVLSTQDTVTTRKQQIGCKKYVQIRSVLDIGKAFLSNLAVCTGNNFGVKPKEILPCRFGLTFSDLTTALNIQGENDAVRDKSDASNTQTEKASLDSFIEENMKARSQTTDTESIGSRSTVMSSVFKIKTFSQTKVAMSTKNKAKDSNGTISQMKIRPRCYRPTH